jgi:hypothetical protein
MLITGVQAASTGALAGYSWYRAPDDNLHGIKLRGYVDIPVANFVISPALSYWIGSDGRGRLYDITESLAFKYYPISTQARVAPYFGIEPTMHILYVTLPAAHFGIHGILGADISLSDKLRVPIQSSYGNIFAHDANVQIFTIMIGLTTAL